MHQMSLSAFFLVDKADVWWRKFTIGKSSLLSRYIQMSCFGRMIIFRKDGTTNLTLNWKWRKIFEHAADMSRFLKKTGFSVWHLVIFLEKFNTAGMLLLLMFWEWCRWPLISSRRRRRKQLAQGWLKLHFHSLVSCMACAVSNGIQLQRMKNWFRFLIQKQYIIQSLKTDFRYFYKAPFFMTRLMGFAFIAEHLYVPSTHYVYP